MAFTSAGLANGGRTTHFQIVYQDTIPADIAIAQGNALAGVVEDDYHLLKTWFGVDIQPPFTSPETIQIRYSDVPGGATWTYPPNPSVLSIDPLLGSPLIDLRHLVNVELVEQFAFSQGKAWFYNYDLAHGGNEGAHGEGLSIWAAVEIQRFGDGPPYTITPHNDVTNDWMTSARADWVNTSVVNTVNSPAIGCAVLFLNWLKYQLGYSTVDIIQAAPGTSHLADPLRQVYKNLTGDLSDPFPAFKAVLDAYWPGTTSIPVESNPENPFPLWGDPMRRPFGGGTQDFVGGVTPGASASGSPLLVKATTVTLWGAPSGGSQITDLTTVGGASIATVTSDNRGQLPVFYGPQDGLDVLWADAGGPRRIALYANDMTARIAALEAPGGGGGGVGVIDNGDGTFTIGVDSDSIAVIDCGGAA